MASRIAVRPRYMVRSGVPFPSRHSPVKTPHAFETAMQQPIVMAQPAEFPRFPIFATARPNRVMDDTQVTPISAAYSQWLAVPCLR